MRVETRHSGIHYASPRWKVFNPANYTTETMKYSVLTAFDDPDIVLSWMDPTPAIIDSFHDMMYRAADACAFWANLTDLIDPGLSINQTFTAHQTTEQNIFRSDFRWFAGVALLEVLAVMIVIPLYWGFWKLREDLDLSPFGIGVALQAPLLQDVEPARGVAGVMEEVGDVHTRFTDDVFVRS
ncbi:hypothetical protein LTR78_006461 [Recurvomyces mirabilis]|uniref:Uncharacterized protein n=1 Tax=Recurvomyces mirabilis TaxID=574656 RepID=A0AAE0WKU2_9PEZI|nr:hypothetical protein LTR78_006461 [Recurvomyces mirabilis]KAK5151119.1 hypothetical protein LTS14_009615 [Recurvomyces mirabilis]